MLSNSEKTYKSVSGLTDAEISSVRKKFAPAPKVENKPAAQPAKQSQPVKNDNRDNRQQNQTQSSHSREHRISLVMLMIRSISHRYISQNRTVQGIRILEIRRDNNNRDGQRDNNGGYRNNDRNNGGYRNNDRDNNGGYRNNDRGNNGYRNNDRNNNGGYGNRDNNGGSTGITTVITMAATVTVIIMVTEIMTVTMAAIETMTATTMAVMATVIIMAVTEIMIVTTMVVMVIVIIMAVIETMTATITAVSEMTETDSLEMAASERIMTRTVEDLTEVREEIMTEEILHLRTSFIFETKPDSRRPDSRIE